MLLALALPVLGLQLGAAGTSSLPDDTVAKQGLVALERDFPSGATDPVNVVVDGVRRATRRQQGLTRLRAELAGRPRLRRPRADGRDAGRGSSWRPCRSPSSRAAGAASAAVDRLRDDYVPAAFGAAADRVLVGGTPAEARDSFAVNAAGCRS